MSSKRRNTCYDEIGYDQSSNTHSITDANNLYFAWLAAKKGSDWKPKTQMFEKDWLSQICRLKVEIESRTYQPRKPTKFTVYERGKLRYIHGEQTRDRVVEHSLNDNVVMPAISKYLIYDNGASIKGKGVDFTRRRIVKHLTSYYKHYGNEGYVLIMDFSKYYENIDHKILLDMFKEHVNDENALYLLDTIINKFDLGVDIGNQTSQSAGVYYPSKLDNYIKIVKGVKYYARYNDDSYILHRDKKYLEDLLIDIRNYAAYYNIDVSETKTRIVKISSNWRFLQIQYSLTNTGRVVRKINPKRLTTMRRKMKKLAPIMTEQEFDNWVGGWLGNQKKYLSHKQYGSIVQLRDKLKGEYYV